MDIGNHMFSFVITTVDFVIGENDYIINIKLKTNSLKILNIFYNNGQLILFISLTNQTFMATTTMKMDVQIRTDNE